MKSGAIQDADDEASIANIKTMYESGWRTYIQECKDLHKIVFICRRLSIKCIPGENLGDYFKIDWLTGTISAKFGAQNELLELLQIPEQDRTAVIAQLGNASTFECLDALRDWRGKFHFSFVRSLLLHVARRRIDGLAPFKRAVRIGADPTHPTLLPMLSAYVRTPTCLEDFIRTGVAHRVG